MLALAGGALRTAIIGDDKGMSGPFIGVASGLATDKALAWICARFYWVNRLVEGFPTVLVRDGIRDTSALRRHNVPDAALDRALHAAGLDDERSVRLARLEPNGKITMVRDDR